LGKIVFRTREVFGLYDQLKRSPGSDSGSFFLRRVSFVTRYGFGLNIGFRKGHAGWVLTIVQTGMVWIFFHLFRFKNPASLQQQQVGLIILMVLTFGAGLVGVLITHYRESRVAPFWNSQGV
jgi:hypothetical protein